MKPKSITRISVSLLAVLASVNLASAQTTYYWDGISDSWNTVGNWSTVSGATTPDPLVLSGILDSLVFNISGANANQSIDLDANQSARSLTFNSEGTTTLLGGGTSRTLTLGTGGITIGANAGAVALGDGTAGNDVLLSLASGAQTWTNNSASNFTINNSTASFTRAAGATLSFNQMGAGTFNINTTSLPNDATGIIGNWATFGTGASTRYAYNNAGVIAGFTGTSSTVAAIGNTPTVNYEVAAVGTLGAGANINTLRYAGAAGTIAGALTANGIMNVSGNALTFSGAITSGSGEMVINAANGGLNFSGGLNNSGNMVTVTGSSNVSFAGTASIITGTGGLTINSSGLVTLGSGGTVPAHNYSGNTTITGGGRVMYNNNLSANSNIILNGGILESYWTSAFSRTLGTGGTQIRIIGGESGFAMNGANGQNVSLGTSITWGDTNFNPSKLLLQSGASQSGSSLTFQSAINLNNVADTTATRTIVASAGAAGNATSTISGALTNSAGTANLVKEGAGQLILTNTGNTYNGNTSVTAGTLTAATTGALPGWNSSGKISVSSGSVLGVRGGTSWTQANIDTLIGNVSWASSTSALGFDTTSGNFTYASTLNGSFSVVKYGSANTLTLNSDLSGLGGSLILAAGTIARTAGGDLVTNTIEVRSGTISANIGGTTAVVKNTTGAVTLSGANTYSGGFTLNAGEVTIPIVANYNGFGTGVLTLNGGSMRTGNTTTAINIENDVQWNGGVGFGRAGGGNPIFTFNGDITLGASVSAYTQSGTEPFSLTFNGNIGESSAGFGMNLNASSTGSVWTFNGQNTFTGNLNGNSKALVIGGSGYLGGGNYAGNITAATFAYNSTATQILSGTNTLSSTTTVTAGALVATRVASLSGYNTAGRIIFNGGTVGVRMGDGTTGWSNAQVNTLLTNATKTSGALGIDTTNGDITQWTAFTTTNLGANLGLTKLGSNTLILDQANTYSGATTVTAGTLLIHGSTSASSNFTVQTGGTLGGSGTIGGTITLESGSTLAPGASIESLASGSNVWNGGSTVEFEFSTNGSTGTAGAQWDLLSITGTLDLTGASSGNQITFDLVSMLDATTSGSLASWDPNANTTWSGIVTTTGGITGFASNLFAFDTSGFQNTLNGTFNISQNGNNLDLNYVTNYVIPEPKAALLGAIGVLLLFRRRR